MADKKEHKGKLRRIEIEVHDNKGGYTVKQHREAPPTKDGRGITWDGMSNKPEESAHEDGDGMLDKMHEVIADHEGKSAKRASPKRVPGANILARKGKAEEEGEGD